MARHGVLWAMFVLVSLAALFIWTPMGLGSALFFGLVFVPFLLLAGFGVYHLVHGARQAQ